MNSKNFIGMPSQNLYILGENVYKDSKYANVNGDVVDNSNGVNNVKKIGNNPLKTSVNNTGNNFRMMSAPYFLYKDF